MTRPTLVVRGGTVVDARWSGAADVWVADGRVLALVEPGTPVPPGSGELTELDAHGRFVMPGGVDPHCHVGFTSGDYTSLDDYLACTTAAVFGGTTTVVDFAIPRPGAQPLATAWEQRAKADQGLCDSALHGCVTTWDDTVPQQLAELADAGIRTIKMFTTYRGESMADEDTILRVMKVLRDVGGMAVIHCEANHIIEDTQQDCAAHGHIGAADMAATRPELAETAAVAEILAIAQSVAAPVYFVHQSTPAAVELVSRARHRGIAAFTETVAHHLVLDDSKYAGDEPERYVCCPPLRPAGTVAALGALLGTGDVTTVASDHCCYDLGQKRERRSDVRHMPNGLPGVETRLSVIYSSYVATGLLPMTRFVELVSTNPARTNGLYPRKGTLMPGSDADLVVWDPTARWTMGTGALHMATDYTPYEGMPITGRAETVVVGGRVVVHDGTLIDATPRGRHLPAGAIELTPAVLAR